MDDVFRALADPNRRRLLDTLNARSGLTLHQLCEGLEMARQSVSKHLAILEHARLVVTVRRGREKLHYLNAAPINDITDRWIDHYNRQRVEALADLKIALENGPAPPPPFVYHTYIGTTPRQLWQALTDPDFTSIYWGVTFRSDWRQGSRYTAEQHGEMFDDPEQVVLESEPYRRLSYTWPAFSPEEAVSRSRVSFEMEALDSTLRLTVRHDGFDPRSAVGAGVSAGWPRVLSSLKTLLETGHSLPLDTGHSLPLGNRPPSAARHRPPPAAGDRASPAGRGRP